MAPHEPNLTTPTVISGGFAFVAGLSLNQIAAIIGIFVALGTFAANIYFQRRRDRRETMKLEFEIGRREERRSRPIREEDTP
jgi:hypothetical protein